MRSSTTNRILGAVFAAGLAVSVGACSEDDGEDVETEIEEGVEDAETEVEEGVDEMEGEMEEMEDEMEGEDG